MILLLLLKLWPPDKAHQSWTEGLWVHPHLCQKAATENSSAALEKLQKLLRMILCESIFSTIKKQADLLAKKMLRW